MRACSRSAGRPVKYRRNLQQRRSPSPHSDFRHAAPQQRKSQIFCGVCRAASPDRSVEVGKKSGGPTGRASSSTPSSRLQDGCCNHPCEPAVVPVGPLLSSPFSCRPVLLPGWEGRGHLGATRCVQVAYHRSHELVMWLSRNRVGARCFPTGPAAPDSEVGNQRRVCRSTVVAMVVWIRCPDRAPDSHDSARRDPRGVRCSAAAGSAEGRSGRRGDPGLGS